MPASKGRAAPPRAIGLALASACHPEPTAAVTAISVALAASSGRSLWGTVAAGSAVLAGQLTVGWHNDWLDADRDTQAARADKPIARGTTSRRAVGAAALTAGIADVPLSLLSGYRAGLAHIAAVGLALAYNVRLKATFASFLPYCLAFPLLVAFIALGRHPSLWPPWWALLGAALLGMGAHLANAAPDVAHDMAAGIRGLPQRLGATRSTAAALGFLIAASAVSVWGVGRPSTVTVALGTSIVAVVSGLVLAVLCWPRPKRAGSHRPRLSLGPRAWFRAAMVVALANVALLVARGASL